MTTRKFSLSLSIFVITMILLGSCSQEEKNNVHISGTVEGLRKGKLYLQRLQDTVLVSIDSVLFDNDENFTLKARVEEPELMLLQLQKHGSEDYVDYLTLFVEEAEYDIQTKMISFQNATVTTSSANQKKWEEYNLMLRKFNNQQLDFLAEQITADPERKEMLQKQLDLLIKRKYFYSINFALTNKDLAVSPYVILSEAYDANLKYLDSVYKAYSDDMKASLYGRQFNELLLERKIEEANKEANEKAL